MNFRFMKVLIRLYKMLIWKGNAELYCEHAFRTFDTDQSGFIDLKEFILVVGMRPFFDDQVSGTFMALALALPHANCNIHVTEWFLFAGTRTRSNAPVQC